MAYVYQPSPIIIPEECAAERVVASPASFTNEERGRLDTRTVFYDVFVDSDSCKLRALGPKMFNLERELFPLDIRVGGMPVRFRLDQIDRLVFLESETRLDDSDMAKPVEFQFRSFAKTIHLSQASTSDRLHGDTSLTITTLQKDNSFEWIRDWVLWHCRLYGVGRLILYDNGSSGRDELVSRLRELENEVAIVFVDWKFPHGVTPFKYAQTASLNHARMYFPVRDGYCINLDIDEYLVKPGDRNLLRYLNHKTTRQELGTIAFTQYLVANAPGLSLLSRGGGTGTITSIFPLSLPLQVPWTSGTRRIMERLRENEIHLPFRQGGLQRGTQDRIREKQGVLKKILRCPKDTIPHTQIASSVASRRDWR